DIERRRACGFQNPIRLHGGGYDQFSETNLNAPAVGNQSGRSRVIPYRLLSGSRLFGEWRSLLAAGGPHSMTPNQTKFGSLDSCFRVPWKKARHIIQSGKTALESKLEGKNSKPGVNHGATIGQGTSQ